jgi:hypothetical protein
MAFVMGGLTSEISVHTLDHSMLSSMERYDGASGQWSAVAAMSSARYNFSACAIADELYVIGGNVYLHGVVTRRVEKYTPSTDIWSTIAPMPVKYANSSAVAVSSDLYVLGSSVPGQESTMVKFDTMEGTWSEVAPLPEPRYGNGTCAVGSNIYVFGGRNPQRSMSLSAFKYDTLTNTWSTLAPMPHGCFEGASNLNGFVYIAGAGISHRETLCFDPTTEIWRTLAPMLTRREHCSTFVLSSFLFAIGGYNSESSMERYDVTTDTWTTMVDLPHGRMGFGAVSIGATGPAAEQDLFDSLIAQASARQI